jgi:hypothetical protein
MMKMNLWKSALARNLIYSYYTGNLNHIPEQSGQPGQKPGFYF